MKVAADSSETFGRKVKLGANVVFNRAVYVTGHHSFNFKPKSVERSLKYGISVQFVFKRGKGAHYVGDALLDY